MAPSGTPILSADVPLGGVEGGVSGIQAGAGAAAVEGKAGADAATAAGEGAALPVVVGSFTVDGLTYAVTGEGQVRLAFAAPASTSEEGAGNGADVVLDATDEGMDGAFDDAASREALDVSASVFHEGVDYAVTSIGAYAFAACDAPVVRIPASVTDVDRLAFRTSAAERIEVDPANPLYASYDGALYGADLTCILLVPEGRSGQLRIASQTEGLDGSAFSHCARLEGFSVDADCPGLSAWDGLLYDADGTTLLAVPAGAESISIREGCAAVAPGALAGCARLRAIEAPASLMSVPPEALGEASGDGALAPTPSEGPGAAPRTSGPAALAVAAGEAPRLDSAQVAVALPENADASPWQALGFKVQVGAIAGQQGAASPDEAPATGSLGAESAGEERLVEPASVPVEASEAPSAAPQPLAMSAAGASAAPSVSAAASERCGSLLAPLATLQAGATSDAAATYSITIHPNGHNLHHNRFLYVPGGSGSESDTTNTTLSSSITLTGRLWYIGSLEDMTSEPTSVSVDGQFRSETDNTFWVDRFWDPWNKGWKLKGFNTTSTATSVLPVRGEQHGNVELFAIWEARKYTVSFNANGGSGGQTAQVTATYDSAMPAISTTKPTRTGYSFQGWYDTASASGGTQYYNANGASVRTWNKDANATLYARWKANTYTVTFNANGGSGGQGGTKTATYASAMPGISTTKPTRTGYTFQGWYDNKTYNASGAKQYYKADGTSARNWDKASNATLYAGWKANTYTISFNANGGSGGQTANVTATYGSAMPGISTTKPTRAGHRFQGWYDSSADSGGTQYYLADGKSARSWNKTANTTLYARWSTEAYSITVNPNGHNLHHNRFLCNATNDQTTNTTLSTSTTIGGRHWYIGDMNDLSSEPKSVSIDGTIASDGTFWVDRFWDPWNPGWTLKGFNTSPTATTVLSPGGSQYKDATLYAIWEANKYSVSFNANGGTGGRTAKLTVTYDSAMPAIPEARPTRTGYAFAGWYDAASGGTQYYDAQQKSARAWNKTSDTTLYAHWTANSYTVEYWDKAGKVKLSTDTGFKYDTAKALAAKPTSGVSTGHTAVGWADSANQSASKYAFGSSQKNLVTSGTKKLYLAETANKYTISFDAKGGTGGQSADVQATFGAAMPAIDTTRPVRPGYQFLGWYENQSAAGGQQYYDANGKSMRSWDHASNWTLRAKWNPWSYEITYDLQGGAADGLKESYTIEDVDFTLPKPTKKGYTFTGWDTKGRPLGTGAATTGDTTVIKTGSYGTFTATAQWKPTSYQVKVDHRGGAFASGASVPSSYTVESAAFTVPASQRTGYTFLGWTGSNGTEPQKAVTVATGSTGDRSYAAQWQANKYTVSFAEAQGEGVQQTSVKATYDQAMPAISTAKPVLAGYTFRGWADTPSRTGGTLYYDADGKSAHVWDKASDGKLYPRWSNNTYTIKFDAKGGTGGQAADVTATFAEPMPPISTTPPVRAGYTFLGWYENQTAEGGQQYYDANGKSMRSWDHASDWMLRAKWQANAYAVSFDANGGTGGRADALTVTYGSAMAAIPDARPTRTGYTFAGWYDAPSGGTQYYDGQQKSVRSWDKASDEVLYAQWTAVSYVIELDANADGADVELDANEVAATYGQPVALPSASRYGYSFMGWDTRADGTGSRFGAGMTASAPDLATEEGARVPLYAQWTLDYNLLLPVCDPDSVTFEVDSLTGQVRVAAGSSAEGAIVSYMAVPATVDELACEGLDSAGDVAQGGQPLELEAIFGAGSAAKVRFTTTMGKGDEAVTTKLSAGDKAPLSAPSVPAATSGANPGRLPVSYGLELDADLPIPPVRDAAKVVKLVYTVSVPGRP